MKKFLLFTSRSCKHCPQMKQNIGKAGMTYIEISMDTEPGKKLVKDWNQKYGFTAKSLPLLVETSLTELSPGIMDYKPLNSYIGLMPLGTLTMIKEGLQI